MKSGFDVVTGATRHTGKYITRKLLVSGSRVKTSTGHPNRVDQFRDKIQSLPFNFDEPAEPFRKSIPQNKNTNKQRACP